MGSEVLHKLPDHAQPNRSLGSSGGQVDVQRRIYTDSDWDVELQTGAFHQTIGSFPVRGESLRLQSGRQAGAPLHVVCVSAAFPAVERATRVRVGGGGRQCRGNPNRAIGKGGLSGGRSTIVAGALKALSTSRLSR
jgi:hypothetical protein